MVDKRPLVASLSEGFAASGALMSTALDFISIDAQLVTMARSYLSGRSKIGAIGVQSSIGATLALNLSVARTIGLEIPPDALSSIGKIFTTNPRK